MRTKNYLFHVLGVSSESRVKFANSKGISPGNTVTNQQNKFKYAPRIEPNNYKYVSYFRPVAM